MDNIPPHLHIHQDSSPDPEFPFRGPRNCCVAQAPEQRFVRYTFTFQSLLTVSNEIFYFLCQGTLWFNIGSVDSFERNLENVQMEMSIDAPNWVPVVYKTEIEPSNLSSFVPTILIIGENTIYIHCRLFFYMSYSLILHALGFLLYMMRRSAEMMGARSGRKGGGLFGGVMESTAKLINSSDIDVKFK